MNPLLTKVCEEHAGILDACMAEYCTIQDPERATRCKIARHLVHIAQLPGDLGEIPEALENLRRAEEIIRELIGQGEGAGH